ncbi:MAG: CooT family nickel-binding protein [Actinomycetota bacterium]
MCESHAYLIEGGQEKLVMEDVVNIREEDGKIHLYNIIGEESVLEAEIAAITFLDHKVLLRPLST